MATAEPLAPPPRTAARLPPPLENGDALTRAEFERRYGAMPGVRAELIDGVVYMASPVRFGVHGQPDALMKNWLTNYWIATPGTGCADNTTVRLAERDVVQPDCLLLILAGHAGRARISDDDYVEGPPELAAEVAASSVSIDMHTKLRAYQRAGVREYVVWRVEDGAVDWFALRDGQYQPLPADAAGVVRSEVFPGLWLDAAALVRLDGVAVQRTLHAGLADPAHAAFVAALVAARP